ncbi:hypothetical protein EXIGLDRAFT_731201, partial [Exidia glandulosa HHB12029]
MGAVVASSSWRRERLHIPASARQPSRLPYWAHKQGVTVIGDEANLMSTFAGAGANVAMVAGLELTKLWPPRRPVNGTRPSRSSRPLTKMCKIVGEADEGGPGRQMHSEVCGARQN